MAVKGLPGLCHLLQAIVAYVYFISLLRQQDTK